MSDIFREVEEDVRRERYERIWKEYGDYIIAAVAIVIIAAAGVNLWRYYEQRQRMRASAEYAAAQQLIDSGQAPAASEAFGKIASTAPNGYAQLARLQEAGALLASGRTADGLKVYHEIASSDDPLLSSAARIRIGWATVETGSRADLASDLGSLTDATNSWSPMARELLAYWDFRHNAVAQSQSEYKAIAANKNAPASVHQRAEAMASYLAAGGGQNYGTLPKPVPPPAAAAPASPNAQGTPKK